MKIWGRKTSESGGHCVAKAAVAGASREELIREAIGSIAKVDRADRVGIWLEEGDGQGEDGAYANFRGIVWDRNTDATPVEWAQLSLESPFPEGLLTGARIIEQELGSASISSIIGPLMELQKAIWIPIEQKGHLRGVLLLGNRKKQPSLPREQAESAAAELTLAIELEEEQRIARLRHADINVARKVLAALGTPVSPDTILSDLMENCMESSIKGNGAGATFAVIGAVKEPESGAPSSTEVEFYSTGQADDWIRTVQSDPVATLWQQALETQRVIGSEPPASWARADVSRVVAIPLEAEGRSLGVLVAGLPRNATSLTTLERLELRASLAARVLVRRHREQELNRQAAWQQALLDAASEATVLLNRRGEILKISNSAQELFGKSKNEVVSDETNSAARKFFFELFRVDDQERIGSWLRRRMEQAGQESIELELHNGIGVWAHATVPKGTGFNIVTLERLHPQSAGTPAERSEAELRNVIEWLEEGVVLFDAQENVRAANTRFEQIIGLTPEESGSHKTLESLIQRLEVQAAEPGRFAERWRELARGIEGGIREELQMVRPSPRILERSARPMLDGVGRYLGRVEIYRDLSAQRVFQSKLLQTEKLAGLGQMMTGVAHELSNPLTSILGYAQRLLLRADSLGRSEEVRQIFQEAERASGILRQLLSSARESQPERRNVSLNQIVHRAVDLQRFSLAAEKIRVELALDPLLPPVRGDAAQLQQVLMNLIGNARQAIEEQGHGGKIRVRTMRNAEDRVRLEVEDDGPGIPRAIQARIFDPFFTTKPTGVGTGLGLSIVLSIVREHGGQVHVVNPPEGGTRFSVELPTARVNEEVEAQNEDGLRDLAERHKANAPLSHLTEHHLSAAKNSRVLVVEDEPTVARLIADVLEEEGFRVEVLLDGREALGRVGRESFDLIICDMKMPGMDGQHFYQMLERANNPLQKRFLFVTGDVVAPQTHEFLERNHLEHLSKPFRVEELTEKVRSVLYNNALKENGAAVAAGRNIARRNG